MSFNFDHLEVTGGATARMELHQIPDWDPTAVLIVRSAGESNRPFFNATLRRTRASQGRRLSESMVRSIRNEDRSLYAQHVIVGWENVRDDKGELVPFSREDCKKFLQALPDWLFDEVRAFCGNLQNFMDEGITDADELGKDSGNASSSS